MATHFEISGRRIGPGCPTFVVAELSANHHHRFEEAVALVRAAHDAGADAIKLQTYTADTLTLDSDEPWFRVGAGTLWQGQRLYDLYRAASTPWEWLPQLAEVARELGLPLFSTPFDASAVEFLAALNVPAYKIASFELVDVALVEHVARQRRPVLMSTGMASLAEIDRAVHAVRGAGNDAFALLKCTSAYPAPAAEMNLRQIPILAERYGVPVGLSDHTLEGATAAAAVALGATIVEKHLTLDRRVPGPDSAFSLEPHEFRATVEQIRHVEALLGDGRFTSGPVEERSRQFRRSLFVVREMRAGEIFDATTVRSIRPGCGLPPHCLPEVLGRRAARDIRRGTPLSWELLE